MGGRHSRHARLTVTTHPLGWPRALAPSLSPCRIDAGKGRHQHPCSPAHRDTVAGYRAYRDGEYARAELVAAGTAHSPRDESPGIPRPTFRDYLTGRASQLGTGQGRRYACATCGDLGTIDTQDQRGAWHDTPCPVCTS
jgi:hypothetical protein